MIDSIRSSPYGGFFHPDSFVYGQTGTGNNFAKGYYTDGPELVDSVLDVVQKEVEKCDGLQGFQMCHCLGGGTGCGMGSLLLKNLRYEYYNRMICTFSVLPSPAVSNSVMEPYNTMMSVVKIADYADFCVFIDNEALFDICHRKGTSNDPGFGDLNNLISNVIEYFQWTCV